MSDHRSNFDPKKAAEDRKQEMKDITDRLEQGVSEIFQSEKYQQFLNTMARFPQYSLNNNLLIMMQKPDATLCQSYTGWKQMGRFVKKGEKGIRILAPAPYKMEREQDKLDEKGKAVLDKDGEPVKETVQINITAFKPVSTFDLSQTDGEPLPTIGASELTGSVEGYATLFEAIKEASPVPIGFEDIKGGAKGYFHTEENRIAIQEGMSEVQNVKTAIHEMAHAKLHNMEAQKAREDGGQTRSSKEVEAESVAYTVCQHFGIDTSDYSFAYVAGWSKGKEMPELKESLHTIRTAASELITAIDEKAQELLAEKEQAPQTLEEKLDQLAGELDQFAYDLDPYGYQDEAGSREEGFAQIQGMLKDGDIESIQDGLRQNLEDIKGDDPELEAQGEKLLQKLEEVKNEMPSEKAVGRDPEISFYVAECSEFHSMGEFHENLTLEQAVEIYKQIPSDRTNGIKAIGFNLQDENILANEFDLVTGGRSQQQDLKELVPQLAEHPLVQKAFEDVQRLMPELKPEQEKDKEAEKKEPKKQSVRKKLKDEKAAEKPKKTRTAKSKKKEETR